MREPSDHIKRKHIVQYAKANKGLDNSDIRLILSRCPIKESWREIAVMILIEGKDEGCVADFTGYSKSQIVRIFYCVLEIFCAVGHKLNML